MAPSPPLAPEPAGAGGFRAWPKAELHSHLDGALRQSTAEELAAAQDLDLPRPLRLVAPDSCGSQAELLTYFDTPLALLQTEEALERAARELAEDSAEDGVDYLEARWAPLLHLRRGLGPEAVIGAVLRGLAAGPIRAVAIVCAMRHHSPWENEALARAAGRFAGRGVVGFDLAGDEATFPALPQRPAFQAAGAFGLHLTCHAGEAGPPAHVEEALRLGAERIAHGATAAADPRLVERLRTEGAVLDLCPTSNWKAKTVPRLDEHPLPGLVRAGVRCTISSDSRTVVATTLTREYEVCSARLGMTDAELRACDATARQAAFG